MTLDLVGVASFILSASSASVGGGVGAGTIGVGVGTLGDAGGGGAVRGGAIDGRRCLILDFVGAALVVGWIQFPCSS